MSEINGIEFKTIANSKLPEDWRTPEALHEFEDFLQYNWEEREIFFNGDNLSGKQQFLQFTSHGGIKPQNYIGLISFKGHQLNIFPKVFRTDFDDDDHITATEATKEELMKNIANWIEYSSKLEYHHINIASDFENSDNLKQLFISLYVKYVKSAMDHGLFFRYEDKNEDLKVIKGKLNIVDYYTKKYPNGRLNEFNCNFSTFEFDNLLNQIIKCTCKYILKDKDTSSKNEKSINKILLKLNDVSDVRCVPGDCDKILLSKMNSNYKIILSMSKMFLMNKESSYNFDNSDSFCFLFPTEMLFESFIGGFIQDTLKDAKVSLQKQQKMINKVEIDDKFYDANKKLRYDIYVKYKNSVIILDTKYKEISRIRDNKLVQYNILNEIEDNDIKQVAIYALKEGVTTVFLLYPQIRYEDLDAKPIILHSDYEHAGKTIKIIAMRIPFVFDENKEVTLENLKKVINIIFE